MEISLLKKGYKTNEQFYQDFLNNQIMAKEEYFSGETVYVESAPAFPIYMAQGSEQQKKEQFLEAFDVLSKYYVKTDRDLHFDELFWHSLLVTTKHEYLLEKYPQIKENKKYFDNIVIKSFDWENYIYKCILAAEYIDDHIKDETQKTRYYNLVVDNLDIYNYIIKYEIFRNSNFLIHILDIIDELGISKIMKSKIEGRDDLAKDERYGRRVIFELNKSYPVIMSPMLDKESLKDVVLQALSNYYDLSNLKIELEMN